MVTRRPDCIRWQRWLAAILLLGYSLLGYSVEWQLVAASQRGTAFYFDADTIERDGNLRRLWLMEDRARSRSISGTSFFSSITFEVFDCERRMSKILGGSYYSGRKGRGKVLHSFAEAERSVPFSRLLPGTFGEQTLNEICAENWLNPPDKINM